MPPIFVISLVRAARRRKQIRARLETAGFQYEFVDATDGAAETRETFARKGEIIDDRLYRLTRGRALSRGEIGCYLSHYKLWKRIAAENPECAIIFEDDAQWDDDLPQVVADIMSSEQQ